MLEKQEIITLIEKMRTFLEEDDASIKEVLSSVVDSKSLRLAFVCCNNPVSEDFTSLTDCVPEDITSLDYVDNVVVGYFK